MRLRGKQLLHFHLSGPLRDGDQQAPVPVGKIGSLVDAYWDDRTWKIRHHVATLGNWWTRHVDPVEVLVDPSYCAGLDGGHSEILIGLTSAAAETLPIATSDAPRSRLRERRVTATLGWDTLWREPFVAPGLYTFPTAWQGLLPPSSRTGTEPVGERRESPVPREVFDALQQEEDRADVHLHSLRDLLGAHVRSSTTVLGSISDVVLDTDSWQLMRFVVDPHPWLPQWLGGGDEVVLAPSDVLRLDDEAREVVVSPAWERAPRGGAPHDRDPRGTTSYQGPV
jgi:hypothetical protein